MKQSPALPVPRLATALLAAAALCASAPAQSQLISGWNAPAVDDGNPVSNFAAAWSSDVSSGAFTTLPVLGSPKALAADPASGRLFASAGSSLNTFVRDAEGVLVRVGSAVRIRDLGGVGAESYQVESLAFANGVLYASLSRRSGDERRRRGIARGFYAIDPATAVATPIAAAAHLPPLIGLDHNPQDGLLYGVIGGNNAQSIVSIDPTTFAYTHIVSLPASAYAFGVGAFAYDGVAVGQGKVYLTHGIGYASIPILVFDLATWGFGAPLPTPPRSGENRFYPSGATFLEPAGR